MERNIGHGCVTSQVKQYFVYTLPFALNIKRDRSVALDSTSWWSVFKKMTKRFAGSRMEKREGRELWYGGEVC